LACNASNPSSSSTDEAARQALTSTALLLNWYPEAEHGGFFAAESAGFFAENGLKVDIKPGGPSVPVLQEVARGRVTFGISNADNLLAARAQEAPVVALFAPLQMSPRCILVHEKSGIRNFDQLSNVQLAVTPGANFAEYLRRHAPLKGVEFVPYSGNVAQFLLHPNYAQQGYVFSEPFVAREQGGDPLALMISDLGFNPYTSVLFTTEDVIRQQPDLVRRFVAAIANGWQNYLQAPESTNALIHARNPEMDPAVLAYGVEAIRPLMTDPAAPAAPLGQMTRERWQTLADQLVEIGAIPAGSVDVDQVFTNDFLPSSPSPPEKVSDAP
jgi:NitT/TauT family transport system substrate-binding protein